MANDEKKQKNNKHFFKDFKAELKKVIWPTPKQLVNNTIAVITIVLILAIIVFFLDIAFEALNTYGIDKIRSAVSTSEEQSDTNGAVENNNETTENNTTENNTTENNTTENSTTENKTTENKTNNNTTENKSNDSKNDNKTTDNKTENKSDKK